MHSKNPNVKCGELQGSTALRLINRHANEENLKFMKCAFFEDSPKDIEMLY
jgi:hypothetical protein